MYFFVCYSLFCVACCARRRPYQSARQPFGSMKNALAFRMVAAHENDAGSFECGHAVRFHHPSLFLHTNIAHTFHPWFSLSSPLSLLSLAALLHFWPFGERRKLNESASGDGGKAKLIIHVSIRLFALCFRMAAFWKAQAGRLPSACENGNKKIAKRPSYASGCLEVLPMAAVRVT